MKYNTFTFIAIVLLSFNFVNAQNVDKHINRLVGEIDQEWLITAGETIPANQVEYSSRKVVGFESTSIDARKQVSLDQSWYLYKNIEGRENLTGEDVQIPHQFERNRKYKSAWYLSKYKIKKEFGKRYFLKLSRIDLLSLVYVNGQKCGSHIGSYTPFEIDITNQLITPPNTLKKEKRPAEVLQKIRHALQPVSVFFWPRETYCSAKEPFQRELVVCNDSENAGSFEIEWKWGNQPGNSEIIEMNPGEQRKIFIKIKPPTSATNIIASVKRNNRIVSVDTLLIHPIPDSKIEPSQTIQVFGDEVLADKLSNSGYKAVSNKRIPGVSDNILWIIPEHANNRELEALKEDILNYLNEGGNILCLKQNQTPSWFPVQFQFWSANLVHLHSYEAMGWSGLNKDLRYAKYATILAASHPVFEGIKNPSLHLWNQFDGRVADDAYVRPGDVGKYEQGNWRPLAASAKNTQISLAEIFYGKGTLLACQLHVIENLQNPQAKRLFDNMLNYLSDSKSEPLSEHVVLTGNLNTETITELTGANLQNLSTNNTSKYLLAFEGAEKTEIQKFAAKGGTVMVLSDKVSNDFEGVTTVYNEEDEYTASKINDHPLLYGISSGNFKASILNGTFKNIPDNAKVLLQGFVGESNFWNIKEAGPVMISLPYEQGEIIMSTINIDEQANNHKKEFLRQILTNTGVLIPYTPPSNDVVVIKKTVPITVDGILDEWLDDMDDSNVSQYVHANPIYITSQNRIEGPSAYDLRLSGINYFLWNKDALYIAGVIFSEEKTAISTINYGAKKEYSQQIKLNNDVFEISFRDDKLLVKVNGKINEAVRFENGQLDSKFMTDATKLQFSYINGGGEISTVKSLVGETFELMIPWENLKTKSTHEPLKTMISIESKGTKLQMPISANPESLANWLPMRMSRNVK